MTSLRGKSKVNPYHPLFKGVFGMGGHQSARTALADESVELILAIGTSFGQMGTASWHPSLMNEKLVHIYHSDTYFPRSAMARLQVCGTAKLIFQQLNTYLDKALKAGEFADLVKDDLSLAHQQSETHASKHLPPPQLELQRPELYQDKTSPIKPPRLMYELMRRFPTETRFLLDNGTAVEWTVHYFFLKNFANYRLMTTGPCSMGWAAGSAIGTALGNRGTPVVSIIGDASYLMYGHEITVAVTEKLPVIFIILNDSGHGAVKHRNNQIGTEKLEFAICKTDFAMMAESVGATGYSIHHPDDFDKLDFQKICQHSGPTVIDVYIDPNEAPPIGA